MAEYTPMLRECVLALDALRKAPGPIHRKTFAREAAIAQRREVEKLDPEAADRSEELHRPFG